MPFVQFLPAFSSFLGKDSENFHYQFFFDDSNGVDVLVNPVSNASSSFSVKPPLVLAINPRRTSKYQRLSIVGNWSGKITHSLFGQNTIIAPYSDMCSVASDFIQTEILVYVNGSLNPISLNLINGLSVDLYNDSIDSLSVKFHFYIRPLLQAPLTSFGSISAFASYFMSRETTFKFLDLSTIAVPPIDPASFILDLKLEHLDR